MRQRLPLCRESLTQKNSVGDLDFYVTVGFYEDHPLIPGEVFIHIAKEGSTLGGICTSLATAMSIGFQHGVPWKDLKRHMLYQRFEPSGLSADGTTTYPSLPHAIAHTIQMILDRRAVILQLTSPPGEVVSQSQTESSPQSPAP